MIVIRAEELILRTGESYILKTVREIFHCSEDRSGLNTDTIIVMKAPELGNVIVDTPVALITLSN
jgi:hypothetical protein